MKAIADFIIAIADLVEAEVKVVRRSLFRFLLAAVLITSACLLFLGGLALLFYSLYVQFGQAGMSPAGAAAVTGVIFAGAGVVVAGVAIWLSR